jgi:hypothetical protein
MFSKSDAHVLEAFAGSCPSLYGAMTLGRNISLVEKHQPFFKFFEQHFNNVVSEIKKTSEGKELESSSKRIKKTSEGKELESSSKRKATDTKSDESEELDEKENTDAEGGEGSVGMKKRKLKAVHSNPNSNPGPSGVKKTQTLKVIPPKALKTVEEPEKPDDVNKVQENETD